MNIAIKYTVNASQESKNYHPSISKGGKYPVATTLDTDTFNFDAFVQKSLNTQLSAFIKETGYDADGEFDNEGFYKHLNDYVTTFKPISKAEKLVVANAVQASLIESGHNALASWAHDIIDSLSVVNARKLVLASKPHAEKLVAILEEQGDTGVENAQELATLISNEYGYVESEETLPSLDAI